MTSYPELIASYGARSGNKVAFIRLVWKVCKLNKTGVTV